jgi:hypothetical protein
VLKILAFAFLVLINFGPVVTTDHLMCVVSIYCTCQVARVCLCIGPYQQLYVRLFLRKHHWIRISKISYPDIASDLSLVIRGLCEKKFLVNGIVICTGLAFCNLFVGLHFFCTNSHNTMATTA